MTYIDPTLTEIKDKETRSRKEYWVDRVQKVGNHKSPFMDKPQKEIDAFTARHRQWVEPWVAGREVLEIGCGYGRTMDMFRHAKRYIGVDCVPDLLDEARVKFVEVFKGEPRGGSGIMKVDLRGNYPLLSSYTFDVCVAIAIISSVEPYFHELKRNMLNLLRPGGVILWLEEDYTRVDYK